MQVNIPSCQATKGLESHPENDMDSSKKLALCYEQVSGLLVLSDLKRQHSGTKASPVVFEVEREEKMQLTLGAITIRMTATRTNNTTWSILEIISSHGMIPKA